MAQRLGDQHAALHAAGQFHDLGVALVPQRQVAQHLFDIGAVARAAEQPAREGHGRQHGFEHVDRQFLRNQTDEAACRLVIGERIVAGNLDRPGGGRDDAADDADQSRFAGAVGAEESEDLPLVDRQIDAVKCCKSALVGL